MDSSNSVIESSSTLGRVKGKPMVSLYKHQKKILIACAYDDCFHPATQMVFAGTRKLWFCDCHHPTEPAECDSTKVEKENENHKRYGDCSFCSNAHSKNILQGIDGAIVYVCDHCYRVPLHELRRYWRRT